MIAVLRAYKFNKEKINWDFSHATMPVTSGQMNYETAHLLQKLKNRDTGRFKDLGTQKNIDPHPMFYIIKGEVEKWENRFSID